MIWAILVGAVGVAFIAIGALAMLASIMPNFGGGSSADAWLLPFGAIAFGWGIAVVFIAGSLAP